MTDPRILDGFRYRPEIDGLRAVAVIMVVLYHLGLGVPGGFVGVDVFFVISGYLISSLILKDLESGSFSLASFWERRVRRILPAALVVLGATLIGAWHVVLPMDLASIGQAVVAQVFFGSNVLFWRTTGYFGDGAHDQPLLHMWSLAVEEQFYLLFPVAFAALFRVSPPARRRWTLGLGSVVGLLASLAASVVMVEARPVAAFYLLPTRAWELLVGVLIALAPRAEPTLQRALRGLLAWTGLALLITPAVAYSAATPFPGWAALPPCIGTALFIWATDSRAPSASVAAGRLLESRGAVFVGLISYSLYLWHWPLISLTGYWKLGDMSASERAVLFCVILGISYASWRWVETPFRKGRVCRTPRTLTGLIGSVAAALLVVGSTFVARDGIAGRFPSRVNALAEVRQAATAGSRVLPEIGLPAARRGEFPQLGAGEAGTVLVWGDSHAHSIIPGVAVVAAECGYSVTAAWHSSTAPALGYESWDRFALRTDSTQFSQAVADFVRRRRVAVVLLAAFWGSYPERDRNGMSLHEGVRRTVETLRAYGAEVWLLRDVPAHPVAVPMALARQELFGGDLTDVTADRNSYEKQSRPFLAVRAAAGSAGAQIVDLEAQLFDPRRGLFKMEDEGVPLYLDNHHLTPAGARMMSPSLRRMLAGKCSEPPG